MPILNYSTSIDVTKTAGEIQARLAKAGARAILTEYNDQGSITGMSFQLKTEWGIISYKMPVRTEGVLQAIKKDRKCQPRYCNRDQAQRVAWRIMKDWIAAQLAFIEADMARMTEVFLPYAVNPADGQTVFEALEGRQFNGIALLEGPKQ